MNEWRKNRCVLLEWAAPFVSMVKVSLLVQTNSHYAHSIIYAANREPKTNDSNEIPELEIFDDGLVVCKIELNLIGILNLNNNPPQLFKYQHDRANEPRKRARRPLHAGPKCALNSIPRLGSNPSHAHAPDNNEPRWIAFVARDARATPSGKGIRPMESRQPTSETSKWERVGWNKPEDITQQLQWSET